MKQTLPALAAAAMIAFASPAMASFTFSLPQLTYPETPGPVVSQGCSDVTSLTTCEAAK